MKKMLVLLLILLMIPVSLAEITLRANQDIYNLGNKIKASASLLQDRDFEGLFRLSISCTENNLQYFTTPVSLEANSITALQVPDLTALPQMLGNCLMAGDLLTGNNLLIGHAKSEEFKITHNLGVFPLNEKITSIPGKEIKITGIVNEAYGNNAISALLNTKLGGEPYQSKIINGKFSFGIQIPPNIKSGNHEIEILVHDSKNNLGTGKIELAVEPIPSYIKLVPSRNAIDPGTKIEIVSSLYDQADDLINTTIELVLKAAEGEAIFAKNINSGEKIDYEFSQFSKPGLYILAVSYQNLAATSSINVSSVRNVDIRYENQNVFLENIGNIPFIEELTFILQNELDRYTITKKVDLEPGKLVSIDLSKEVPYGIYNVLMPIKQAAGAIGRKLNNSILDISNKANGAIASGVQINDNRPVYRKIASGLGSISGNLVGADGILTKNPLIAPAILAAILLLIFLRYGRKPVMNLVRGKKSAKEEKKK